MLQENRTYTIDMDEKKLIIKSLWEKLPNDGSKTEFIQLCAKTFGRTKKTIRQWWFSNYGDWSVPNEFQEEVIELLNIRTEKILKL